MEQLWERYYPLVFSTITLILSITFKLTLDIPGFEKVLDSVITFSSIIIGFLGALLAIILSISKSEVMQHLYKHTTISKGKNLLQSYFKQAIISGFLIVILTIFIYIFKESEHIEYFGELTLYIWIFNVVFFILSSYRIISVLMVTLFKESENSNINTKNKTNSRLSEDQIQSLKDRAKRH